MKLKNSVFMALTALLCASGLFSQTAENVSRTITYDYASLGDTCYYLAVYKELVPDEATARDSYTMMCDKKLCHLKMNPMYAVNYKQLAGLCMKTFGFRGGIMYGITHSDHYAFRELQARGYISSETDPRDYVSGSNMLNLINRCVEAESGIDKKADKEPKPVKVKAAAEPAPAETTEGTDVQK